MFAVSFFADLWQVPKEELKAVDRRGIVATLPLILAFQLSLLRKVSRRAGLSRVFHMDRVNLSVALRHRKILLEELSLFGFGHLSGPETVGQFSNSDRETKYHLRETLPSSLFSLERAS